LSDMVLSSDKNAKTSRNRRGLREAYYILRDDQNE